MGAVTTASNSTSWTNSSSPKKKQNKNQERKTCPSLDILESLAKTVEQHGTKRGLLLQGWEQDLPPQMAESSGTDVTAKIISLVPLQTQWKGLGLKVWASERLSIHQIFVPWLNRLSTAIASNPCLDLSSGCPGERTPATPFHSRSFLQNH